MKNAFGSEIENVKPQATSVRCPLCREKLVIIGHLCECRACKSAWTRMAMGLAEERGYHVQKTT